MNFSEEVKNEILKKRLTSAGEKKAFLSAALKTAGTLSLTGGKIGFEVSADNRAMPEVFAGYFADVYFLQAQVKAEKGKKRARYVCAYLSDATEVLDDLGIIAVDAEGVKLKFDLKWELLQTDGERAAYVCGAFAGGGSVTLPKTDGSSSTGYHLEVTFANYVSATDFCEVLSELYFLPKLINRKESFIVYLKNRDEIAEFLSLAGAEKSADKLAEVSVEKDLNNNYNRQLNCEISNMSKQMDASAKQILAIRKLRAAVGELPPQLESVARAREEYKNDTLSQLAERLHLSKSCLNHRLRKITELSEEILK